MGHVIACLLVSLRQATQEIDELMLTLPNGPFYEYFYIEVPVSLKERRRFVYVHDETKLSKDFSFPMQFGVEVFCTLISVSYINRNRWQQRY